MNSINCPVCGEPLAVSPAKSRKAKKPKTFLFLKCPLDGRHFRAFINDQEFVTETLERAAMIQEEEADMEEATGTGKGGGRRG